MIAFLQDYTAGRSLEICQHLVTCTPPNPGLSEVIGRIAQWLAIRKLRANAFKNGWLAHLFSECAEEPPVLIAPGPADRLRIRLRSLPESQNALKGLARTIQGVLFFPCIRPRANLSRASAQPVGAAVRFDGSYFHRIDPVGQGFCPRSPIPRLPSDRSLFRPSRATLPFWRPPGVGRIRPRTDTSRRNINYGK